MRQCWRCGGELTPYSLRCSWCGRSTFVSAFFQVGTLVVLAVGGLFVAGLVPTDRLEPYLPFLRADEVVFTASIEDAPEPAGHSGAGAVPDAYATPSSVAGGTNSESVEAAQPARRRMLQPARPGCNAPSAVHRLASRHPGWSEADLALIACGRVRRGFTPGQVQASRGEPRSIEYTAPGVEVWTYPDAEVTFAGSLVVAAE